MSVYAIKVVADTGPAKKAFKALGDELQKQGKKFALDKTGFTGAQKAFKDVGNAAAKAGQQAAKSSAELAKSLQTTAKAANPRTFLTGAFQTAGASAMKLVDTLSKVTIALYGINAAAGVLTRSFGKLFNETIGRAAKFEATLLKTKTTLASTNDVFVDGQKVTDPLKAIDALTGSIDERIKSIRLRTLELAGVTSSQVVEVFGIVASQAGQIGASLEEAEDLAINFAGALGTFGIPLYQARQEITSILQGTVNQDSYLAKALGITNEDIQKARSEIGGITKFLQDRLGTAVAGQAIAAKQLSGVTSNIVEVWEEFALAVGQVALDPLIDGLTFVFETLLDSLKVIQKIGGSVGKVVSTVGRGFANGAGFNSLEEKGGTGDKAKESADKLFKSLDSNFQQLNARLTSTLEGVAGAIGLLTAKLAEMLGLVTDKFASLADAILKLGLVQFESLISGLSVLSVGLTEIARAAASFIGLWADFLRLPLVQTIVRLQTTFKLLQVTGVSAFVGMIAKIVIFKGAILAAWQKSNFVFQQIKRGIGTVIAAIGKLIASIGAAMRAFIQMGVVSGRVSAKQAKQLKATSLQLTRVGNSAKKAGLGFRAMGAAIKFSWQNMKGLIVTSLKFLAVQAALILAFEAFAAVGRYRDGQKQIQLLNQSLKTLDRTAKSAADGSISDLDKKLREVALMRVATEIDKLVGEIEELDAALAKIDESGKPGAMGTGGVNLAATKLREQREANEKQIAKLRAKLGEDAEKDVAEIRKKEAKKFQEEIAKFQRSQQSELFRKRMELARAEVDLYRQAGELRIRQMEEANRKLIEGEEGASRSALEALNQYLAQKKRGELNIDVQRKNLELQMQNRAKQLEDYRLRIQEQINNLRKKIGEYEKGVADYRLKQARKEGDARKNGSSAAATGKGRAGNFGSDAVGRLAGAIVSKESGGDYGAHNMDAGNGGAIGIGQVMAANVGPWTEKYYGTRLTPEAFKKNHEAQDAVVRGRVGERYAQMQFEGYGEVEAARRVAAEWYSGNPDLHTSTRPQYAGGNEYPSISAYADDVVSRMQSGVGSTKPVDDSGLTDISSDEIEKINVELGESEARAISIAEQINNVTDAAGLRNVAKQLFNPASLEQYQDQIKTLEQEIAGFSSLESEIETRRQREAEEKTQTLAGMERLKKEGRITDEEILQITKDLETAQTRFNQSLDDELKYRQQLIGLKAQRDIQEELDAMQESNDLMQERLRLENEGLSAPYIEGEMAKLKARLRLNEAEAEGAENIAELRQEYQKLVDEIDRGVQLQMAAEDPLNNLFKQWREEISDTRQQVAQLAATVASELGSAMSNAITSVIDGTGTVEEAFGQMFKNIGKAFINMATEMIAKALVMKALGILGFGPKGGGGFGATPPDMFGGRQAYNPFTFEGGGYTGQGTRAGGLDGRGGFLSVVHPNETIIDHESVMNKYAPTGGGLGGGSSTIRFESTVINSVEFVTTEQAMKMSRQAADDGARRGAAGGHARSMSTLRNSRSQRAKVGLGR